MPLRFREGSPEAFFFAFYTWGYDVSSTYGKHTAWLGGALCAALGLGLSGASVHAEDTIADALNASKPILESSLRAEDVDQFGIANKANALSWRNRLGFQSGDFNGFKLLIEVDNTSVLTGNYNSTLNGKTAYPTVLDPAVTEINRAQIAWTPTDTTTLTAGRQRIILDDARFVGNAGWRQDEQTMDGLRLDTTLWRVKLTAAYLNRINRVVGDAKDWNSNSYLLNAGYSVNEALKFTTFDYMLKFSTAATAPTPADATNAKASSVSIAGLRAYGSEWVSSFKLGYILQTAQEKNAGFNPNHFTLNEYMAEVNATYDIYTAKVNYESLGGNGTVGFVTPIGTTHAFQGWADVFSASGGNKTLVNGIDDLSYGLTIAGHTKPWAPWIMNPTVTIIYHDLSTARLNTDVGKEWDAMVTAGITKNLSITLKYADFERANSAMPASRNKTWIMFQYKL